MGRRKLIRELHVYLNDSLVGQLVKQTNGAVEFSYDEDWIKNGYAISLSLPLADKRFIGEKAGFYFDNLLPENKKILEAIAQKFHVSNTQQFDILDSIGKDCVGALSFYPPGESPNVSEKMKARPLSDKEIKKKIQHLASDNPLGMEDGDFRISLAGAQEKMALLYWNDKWWEPQGSTPTSHIIKKRMGKILGGIDFSSSVDNEWIGLRLAALFGVKTCKAHIEDFDGERSLVVERFDRAWRDKKLWRIPQEDICQGMGLSPNLKYERDGGPGIAQIMQLLESSNNASADRKALFKLAMVNDLLHNTDGHSKNVSLYVARRGFAMTPAYDIMSAHFLRREDPDRYSKLRSSWSVNGKFHYHEVDLKDWKEQAKLCALAPEVFDDVCHEVLACSQKISEDDFKSEPQIDKSQLELVLEGTLKRARFLFR